MQFSSLLSFCVATAMAGLLAQFVWCQQQQQQQQVFNPQQEPENGPEPYSFSYNSESLGAMSSHQESGDGRGRVQGFYTILGEDGRERRVDYVADENGYRASITTNEIGTRSQSAADAQYNVQPPSQAQLDQAKVTAQEYEYLESSHAAERQRHFKQLSSNQQVQAGFPASKWNQQQQQQFDGNSQRNSQSGSVQNTNSPPQQQTGSVLQNERNWTEAQDEGWRRAKSLNLQLEPQPQPQLQAISSAENQNQLPNQLAQPTAASSAPPIIEYSTHTGQGQQGAASLEEASSSSGNFEQVPQRQQAQQAAWQMTSRGALPARRAITVMQRQLEQQFMQQANQLTQQDYPRQPSLQPAGYAGQQQQQQQPSWSQANQYDTQRGQQLRPFVDQQQQQQQQENVNQFQQQQSNIIDEVAGEQVEPIQPLVSVNQQPESDFRFNKTPIKRPVVEQSGQQQLVAYTEPTSSSTSTTTGAPIVYTTTTQAAFKANTTNFQPTPSGFLAINLQNSENTSEAKQNLDQEVDSQRPSSGLVQAFKQINQQTSLTGQVKGQQTGDFQRVNYSQQLPTREFRPNSIKQIIESQAQQQQQQRQQQQQEEQIFTTTTPAAIAQPETTPTRTIVSQPLTTREPEPLTTKQTQEQTGTKLASQLFDQSTTARAPYTRGQEASYGYSQSGSNQTQEDQQLELATTRRPAFFSQRGRGEKGAKAVGTKGGDEYVRTTTYIRPQPQPQPQTTNAYQKQSPTSATYQPTRQTSSSGLISTSTQGPLVEQQEVNTSTAYQQGQETTTSSPVVVESSAFQRQGAAVATGSLALNNERQTAGKQQQQQQQVIETASWPARPSFVGVDRNTQLQQQIHAFRTNSGSKGASSKVAAGQRKQFWQPLAARQQVQPAPQPLVGGAGRPSVDYANSAGPSAQSSGGFGSRILAGR